MAIAANNGQRKVFDCGERMKTLHWQEGLEARRRYVTAIQLIRAIVKLVNCRY